MCVNALFFSSHYYEMKIQVDFSSFVGSVTEKTVKITIGRIFISDLPTNLENKWGCAPRPLFK